MKASIPHAPPQHDFCRPTTKPHPMDTSYAHMHTTHMHRHTIWQKTLLNKMSTTKNAKLLGVWKQIYITNQKQRERERQRERDRETETERDAGRCLRANDKHKRENALVPLSALTVNTFLTNKVFFFSFVNSIFSINLNEET